MKCCSYHPVNRISEKYNKLYPYLTIFWIFNIKDGSLIRVIKFTLVYYKLCVLEYGVAVLWDSLILLCHLLCLSKTLVAAEMIQCLIIWLELILYELLCKARYLHFQSCLDFEVLYKKPLLLHFCTKNHTHIHTLSSRKLRLAILESKPFLFRLKIWEKCTVQLNFKN